MNQSTLLALWPVLLLMACSSSSTDTPTEKPPTSGSTHNPVSTTYQPKLEGTSITLELPLDYQRTRRYQLEQALADYPRSLFDGYEEFLENRELFDGEADIFIDTTDQFSHLVIHNVSKINLDQEKASQYASNIDLILREHADKLRGISSERVGTTYNEGDGKKMLKLRFRNSFADDRPDLMETIYLITDSAQSFFIAEFGTGQTDLERSFWSIRY